MAKWCPIWCPLVSLLIDGGHENAYSILAAHIPSVTDCEPPMVCYAHFEKTQVYQCKRGYGTQFPNEYPFAANIHCSSQW